jgi:tetratricopeptide (TPR) repeat protein
VLVRLDLQSGQAADALSQIKQAIARAPQNPRYYDLLAETQLASKDPQSAQDSANKALQLDANDEDALRLYTQAKIVTQDPGAAVQRWTAWASAHPRDAQAPAMLGMLSEAAGDTGKAITYYQKALELQPDQPVVSNNLAYLMVESGQNLDLALSMAQSARRSLPNSPNTADTLAWVYYKKGIYDSALDLLQQASTTDPKNASVQYHMGLTLEKLNRKADAQAHLKNAVTLAAGTDTGKKAQAELDRLG